MQRTKQVKEEQTTLAVDLEDIPQAVTALWKKLQEVSKNSPAARKSEQIAGHKDRITELKRKSLRQRPR